MSRLTSAPPPPLPVVLKTRALALDGDIVRRLRESGRLPARARHEIRIATKRLRAWWRLGRPVASRTAIRNADRRLAAAAQLLAPLRDVDVMRQLLRRLAAKTEAAGGDRTPWDRLGLQLAAGGSPSGALTAPDALRRQLLRSFTSDDAAWRRLPVAAGNETILAEMVRMYRRVRKRGRRAFRRDTADALHAWRKWVKTYLLQLELLQAARPRRALDRLVSDFARLGRMLGRSQDLAILDGWIGWRASTGGLARKEARALRAELARHQAKLATRCKRLAQPLFATKPQQIAALLALPRINRR